MKKYNLAALSLCALIITACGGGGGGGNSSSPTQNPNNTTETLPNGAVANYTTVAQTITNNQPVNSTIIIQSPESQSATIYTVTYSVANKSTSAKFNHATQLDYGVAPTVTTVPAPCVITGTGSCEVTISSDGSPNGVFEITGNISATGINQELQPLLVTVVGSTPTPTQTPSPTPTPTPDATLQNYVNLLYYTAPIAQKSLTDNNLEQSQMTMQITNQLAIKNITVNYYSDAACTYGNSSYSMNGSSTLNVGKYTTTSTSNLFLCSNYTSSVGNGCVYAYSNTHSLRYTVTTNGNTVIQGNCMTNPAWFGERIGYYNTKSNWARNCVTGFNCGYSQTYLFNVN